jgi:hypothetical protein
MDPPDRDGIAIGTRPVVRRGDVAGDEQGRVVLRDLFFDLRVAGDAATAAAVPTPAADHLVAAPSGPHAGSPPCPGMTCR